MKKETLQSMKKFNTVQKLVTVQLVFHLEAEESKQPSEILTAFSKTKSNWVNNEKNERTHKKAEETKGSIYRI